MKVKELTENEFKSTFSEKMNNVTNTVDTIIDIWKYINLLEESEYFINDYVIEKRLIEKVYRNSEETYDQILIPTKKNIYGHYLLDLNKENGIK